MFYIILFLLENAICTYVENIRTCVINRGVYVINDIGTNLSRLGVAEKKNANEGI